MHPALLYIPGDKLSRAELCAARLDGDVIDLADAYLVTDTAETPAARAAALAPTIPAHSVVMASAAAWIYGARMSAPTVIHLDRRTRLRADSGVRLRLHDTTIPAAEVIRFGAVAVTTPERTLADLARLGSAEPALWDWAEDLLAAEGEDLASRALELLRASGRSPYKRNGVAFLEQHIAMTR